MAKKILKNRVQFTSTLEKDLYSALQNMSKETKIPISRLLDTAVHPLVMQHMMMYSSMLRHGKEEDL